MGDLDMGVLEREISDGELNEDSVKGGEDESTVDSKEEGRAV